MYSGIYACRPPSPYDFGQFEPYPLFKHNLMLVAFLNLAPSPITGVGAMFFRHLLTVEVVNNMDPFVPHPHRPCFFISMFSFPSGSLFLHGPP